MHRLQRPPRPRHWLDAAALLALAAALRLPGLGYGLPFPLLNPDEESIVPRAFALAERGGLDPGFYDYPSLLFYLLAPLQLPFDEPSYGAARAVAAVVGLAGVAAAWWLGSVAYGRAAGLVAGGACAVATTHVLYSHMAVTDVLLTTATTVALALLVTGRLEWAGVAIGLAVSAKYPGVVLAVPLLLAGWGRWRRLAGAMALAAATFALTSPFVVLHAGAAADDVSRVQRLARAGWLGFEHDHPAPLAFADRLWESLGPVLLVALAGLALALRRLVRPQETEASLRRADLVLASFALAYFAQLLPLEAHFDRYVLPLVPVLGALAGRLGRLAPVSLALLLVPLVWSVEDVRVLTRTDTRVVAHRLAEAALPGDAVLATDPSTPPLEAARTIALELPGPGRPSDPRRDLGALRRSGVEYVLVTGAIADRVLAARAQYPREARFYDELEASARRVLRVDPGGGRAGPWVALYRL